MSTVRPRTLALGAAGVLVVALVTVLYRIVDVVGEPVGLLALVGATLVLATALAPVLRTRTAATLAALLLASGLGWYLLALPPATLAGARGRFLEDLLSLLTGLSVLRILNVELWVLGFAPSPVFLTWYLGLRRRYVAAAAVGGGALSFFVLTGDAEGPVALLGVVAAAAAVGFGDLEARGADLADADALAVVLAAMVVVALSVSVVPGGAARPLSTGGPGAGTTVEANLVDADERLDVLGSIRLSPEVRFRVRSDEAARWRVGAYDRFTGDGWVRTGGVADYDGRLADPPGASRIVRQTVTAESRLDTMPSAWRPVSVGLGVAGRTRVTDLGGVRPASPFGEGDTYRVVSQVPTADAARLREAGTDYPDHVRERYLELPSSTPDRVARRTAHITANAETPYETARTIERWLRANKDYSLEVTRPEGNVADAFLFEMDAGYCVYYATAMVAMLRTQGIPARFVVGYTAGERVAEDRWVVRGLDSHAWVEVYFPGVGWTAFDPTPSAPRTSAEQTRLSAAREADRDDVDTDRTGGEWTPTPTPTPRPITTTRGDGTDVTNATDAEGAIRSMQAPRERTTQTRTSPSPVPVTTVAATGDGPSLPSLPSRERLALWLVVAAGGLAALGRTGLPERAYRAVWLRWQPREHPEQDVERAYARLEYLLSREARERRAGETVRQYLAAVEAPERARQVGTIRERARYAGEVTADDADRAVALVDALVADRSGPFARLGR